MTDCFPECIRKNRLGMVFAQKALFGGREINKRLESL